MSTKQQSYGVPACLHASMSSNSESHINRVTSEAKLQTILAVLAACLPDTVHPTQRTLNPTAYVMSHVVHKASSVHHSMVCQWAAGICQATGMLQSQNTAAVDNAYGGCCSATSTSHSASGTTASTVTSAVLATCTYCNWQHTYDF